MLPALLRGDFFLHKSLSHAIESFCPEDFTRRERKEGELFPPLHVPLVRRDRATVPVASRRRLDVVFHAFTEQIEAATHAQVGCEGC